MTDGALPTDYLDALRLTFERRQFGLPGAGYPIPRGVADTSVVEVDPGLTSAEIRRIEETFEFHFPPDLRSMLQAFLPRNWWFPDWRYGTEPELRWFVDAPLEGTLFDVEHDSFWWPTWGEKPSELASALDIARSQFKKFPKLIPLEGGCYLPDRPCEAGNPVIVMQ